MRGRRQHGTTHSSVVLPLVKMRGVQTVTEWPQHLCVCASWPTVHFAPRMMLLLSCLGPDALQVGTYGDPGRDPRGWTVTVAYAAVVPSTELGVKAAVSTNNVLL